MARHWRTQKSLPVETPNGARRAMLLIGGIIVAGLLAIHLLAPHETVQTAQAPITSTR